MKFVIFIGIMLIAGHSMTLADQVNVPLNFTKYFKIEELNVSFLQNLMQGG